MDDRDDRHPLILLAGGKSQRLGKPKGLMSVDGHPWLLQQLDTFAKAGGVRATVVLGHQHEEYLDALEELETAHKKKHPVELCGLYVNVAINPEPDRGPFSSLQCGARALELPEISDPFILPIDVPCAGTAAMKALADAIDISEDIDACVPEYQGKGGHPVLLSARFVKQLLTIPPEARQARLDVQLRILPNNRNVRVRVDDERVVMNLNTLSDWKRFGVTPADDV